MTKEEMYKEIIEKRLARKREQLKEVEETMQQGGVTPSEKRVYLELRAVITELENILDLTETVFKEE